LISYALCSSSVLVLNLFVFNVLPFSRSLARFGFGAVLLAYLSIHFMVIFFLWILEGSLRERVLVSSAILVTSTPLPLLVFHLLLLFLVGLCGVTRFVLCIAFLADLGRLHHAIGFAPRCLQSASVSLGLLRRRFLTFFGG
jgi:hypothetical protein